MTIIFNDIPAFLDICTKCDGMKIVTMLNTMFGIFDNLSDRNEVYKVETVKDSPTKESFTVSTLYTSFW